MKILIADDNRDILETTSLVLELDGHEVHTVDRAEQILARARQHVPDVLLQDLNMPRMDLAGLLRQLRAEASLRDLGILVFSAALPDEEELEAWGADGFISKPFDVRDLRKRIASFGK